MPKGVGIIEPVVVFLLFGAMLAFVSVFLGVQPVVFLKSFLITTIAVGIIYAIMSHESAKHIGLVLVLLIFGGLVAGIGFEYMPNYLPFQVVPMSFFTSPTLSTSGSVAIPDAIWMLLIAAFIGLVFAMERKDERKAVVTTILATSIVVFAVAGMLFGLFYGQWGDWMILLTPFAGLPWIGLVISLAYIGIAYGLWYKSKTAFYIYLGVQFIAVVEAVMLAQWISLLINIPLIAYLYLSRSHFNRNVPALKSPL